MYRLSSSNCKEQPRRARTPPSQLTHPLPRSPDAPKVILDLFADGLDELSVADDRVRIGGPRRHLS